MKTTPRLLLCIASIAIVANILSLNISAQTSKMSYPQILAALKQKLPNKSFKTKSQVNAWLTKQVEKRGVGVVLTEKLRDELTKAGASDALIKALLDNSPSPDKEGGPRESTPELNALLDSTLDEFKDAVILGNFEIFRDTVSKPFRDAYTTQQINKAFKSFIDQKEKVVPILRSIEDSELVFTNGPSEYERAGRKMLTMAGYYKTNPLPVKFDVDFIKEDAFWKVIKIDVKIQK